MSQPMEIERRWMVAGWPETGTLLKEEAMKQGYITVDPSVRIREGSLLSPEGKPLKTISMLNFKQGHGIARQEIEFQIPPERFEELETFIGLPLITKLRRTYELADGSHLEVNLVDQGMPSEFWYAEVEFSSVEDARAWNPDAVGLADYLSDDITEQPGKSMAVYWSETRLK